MDKFAIIIVFYVIATIIRLVSSAAKNQTTGKKPTQIRLKPQQQATKKTHTLSPKVVTPPPLPDLPIEILGIQSDEKVRTIRKEFSEALAAREDDAFSLEMSDANLVSSSFQYRHLDQRAFQGIIWSEILRPPVSKRR